QKERCVKMETIELIRVVLGIILILYGLGINWYEKFKDVKYIDQINGVLNGKIVVLVGVLVSAYSTKIGILSAIISATLLIVEEVVLKKKLKKVN
ncbi:hypothetical protein, partial [Romboutsia sp.]|uniref:hypothetical protein n=1 Tax=Romboutsia sp. TaxID=1965302 RepID=UPI003F2F63C8